MPYLDQLGRYRTPTEARETWTRPFAVRVAGFPSDVGQWRLSMAGTSVDSWAEYKLADGLQLALHDSQGDAVPLPDLTNAQSIRMTWIRTAQSLRYRISSASRSSGMRQPHNQFTIQLADAEGADTTPTPDEPVLVNIQRYVAETSKQFWTKILPTMSQSALVQSSTGEVDTRLLTRFAVRYNSVFQPGLQFEFEGRAYVVVSISRKDRRRNLILTTEEIGGNA